MVFDLAHQNLWQFLAAVFALLAAASVTGHWIGTRIRHRRPPADSAGTALGFITGGLLTLFAFMLGIALSMASTRLEARRDSVLHEANAIRTVWLRTSLTEGPEGAEIRRHLREYIKIRIELVANVETGADETRIAARTNELQQVMWRQAEALARRTLDSGGALLATSLNEMFDRALTNRRNLTSHVPLIVARLLMLVSMLAVGAMGYHFALIGSQQAVITSLLVIVWTAAIVLVFDIDSGRRGQIQIDPSPLLWAAESFGPDG